MQNYNDKLQESYVLATNFIKEVNVIGIQKEKILHKTLKYYLCSDESKHEIKIKKSNSGILYADVYDNEMIYEIQTRGFDKLRDKLSEFLIEHKVTIVHAVAHKKNIYKVYELSDSFYIYANKQYAWLVNKNSFSIGNYLDFSEFLRKKCWRKYKEAQV